MFAPAVVELSGAFPRTAEPNVIVVTGAAHLAWKLHGDRCMIPRWAKESELESDLPCFEGEYRPAGTESRIPVYALRLPDERAEVLVADLSEFGVLVQYPPCNHAGEEAHIVGRFCMRIADLNADAEERKRILEAHPEWLSSLLKKSGTLG